MTSLGKYLNNFGRYMKTLTCLKEVWKNISVDQVVKSINNNVWKNRKKS